MCRYEVSTLDEPRRESYDLEITAFPRTYATITVRADEGLDTMWRYAIHEPGSDEPQAVKRHTRTSGATTETETFVLDAPAGRLVLRFAPDAGSFEGQALTASAGRFVVVYRGEPLAEGVPPARPAATREDPHLSDPSEDVADASRDLVAGWFDDARLGDGLFEVHLLLRDLSAIHLSPGEVGAGAAETSNLYQFFFRVLDRDYGIAWEARANTDEGHDWSCFFYTFEQAEEATGRLSRPLGTPRCTYDEENSTLAAAIPEAAVGSPGDGEPFSNLRALVSVDRVFTSTVRPSTTSVDQMDAARYPFALGGPAVWDALNPRLAVPPAPWYADPLAPEHVADTLQVGGALVAAATFLGGALVVRRHRRQTRRLLDRIDALLAAHAQDARASMDALTRLEAEFTRMLRENAITEAQYQVATQRLLAVAARYAGRAPPLGEQEEAAPTPAPPRRA